MKGSDNSLSNHFYFKRIYEISEEILNAPEPVFLLEKEFSLDGQNVKVPFPIVEGGIALVAGEPGRGKTLLLYSLIKHLIQKGYSVLYADYEFSPDEAKGRRLHELISLAENGKFFILTPTNEDELMGDFLTLLKQEEDIFLLPEEFEIFKKEAQEILRDKKLSSRQKVFFLMVYYISHKFINPVVFVDSLEDLISNTSDDAEIKTFMKYALAKPQITFVLNHHLRKRVDRNSFITFRGSQILKAKARSLLIIADMEKEDDFTISQTILIEKIRSKYPAGIDKVYTRIDTNTWDLDYEINTDREAIYILKTAFFILRERSELKKTELIELIRKRVRKSKEKIGNVLSEYAYLFEVKRGKANSQIYTLPEGEKLLELKRFIGLTDRDYEESVNRVRELIEKIPADWNKEITLQNGLTLNLTREVLERNLFRWSRERLDEVYFALAPDFIEVNPDDFPDGDVNLEDLDLDL